MLYHKIIPMVENMIQAVDLGMPVSWIGNGGWIGICGRPSGSYTFFKSGRYYGEFELPFFSIGEEIHVGKKGDELKDRIKWEILDFDKEPSFKGIKFMILKKIGVMNEPR